MNLNALKSPLLCVLLLIAATVSHAEIFNDTNNAIIRNVRVIDGLGNAPLEARDIVVADGRIVSIVDAGEGRTMTGALEIDGKGLTAMPGLVDAHIHLSGDWSGFSLPEEYMLVPPKDRRSDPYVQQTLGAMLYAGVTSALDCGNDHEWIVEMRNRVNSGKMIGPRLFVVGGFISQEPGGVGLPPSLEMMEGKITLVGENPSLTSLEVIAPLLDRYKADGIEIIKLYTGLSPHTARFVVAEAHKRGLKVIADFWDMNLNQQIMQTTGLDGYAHGSAFFRVNQHDFNWMADNDKMTIVTANVGEMLSGLRNEVAREEGEFLKEPLIVDIWGRTDVEHYYKTFPIAREYAYDGPESFYQQFKFGDMSRFRKIFLDNIKGLYDAGVLIAGGTDIPFTSVWAGEGMHRELELLVEAGIPPLDAIKICTSNAAKILRREKQFGAIQEGFLADLLIVKGNPAKDISESRQVQYVFKEGRLIDRAALTKHWKTLEKKN